MTTWGTGIPIAFQTALASAAGSLWRIGITPLDTLKTTLQVEGPQAYEQLTNKVKKEGPTVLYQARHSGYIAVTSRLHRGYIAVTSRAHPRHSAPRLHRPVGRRI